LPEEVLESSKILLIATYLDQFTRLKQKLILEKGIKIVIHGRNYLDKVVFEQAGLVYQGIGR